MRGVGQTQNMIDNLPNDRCVIITPTADLNRSIKRRVEDDRGKEFAKKIKFISVSDSEDLVKLRGLSCPIFFDHSFFDLVEEGVAKEALNSAHASSIIYHRGK